MPATPENGTTPENEGATVIATTVDVMLAAAVEDETDVLETFIVLSEKASKKALCLILLITETRLLCT